MIIAAMEDEETMQTPFFKLKDKTNEVHLVPGKTLGQIEQEMIISGQVKNRVEFFAPDGCAYARSTQVEDMLHFPFFRMRVDNLSEYHCISNLKVHDGFLKMNAT